jgi:hypothetical protein
VSDPETKRDGLQRELASLEARLTQHDTPKVRVIDELSAMRSELARENDRRSAFRIADVRVASPCRERWADMAGDERVRVCNGCERPVFNLSEMTRAEAEAVLATRGVKPCVRFYRRADGTVMTADCPTGARRSPRLAVVAAGTALLGSSTAMAEAPAIPDPAPADTPATTTPVDPVPDPAPDPGEVTVTMGELAYPVPPHSTIEWSTWVRAGYGIESQAPNFATRSITQPMPVWSGTGEAALGADLSLSVANRGKLRVGAWGEVRTSSGPVLGGEVVVLGLAPHSDTARFYGGGEFVFRLGGSEHVVTTALGFGYVGTWSWTGHHLVGARVVASMNRSLDDATGLSATLGVELEPIGALTYVVRHVR